MKGIKKKHNAKYIDIGAAINNINITQSEQCSVGTEIKAKAACFVNQRSTCSSRNTSKCFSWTNVWAAANLPLRRLKRHMTHLAPQGRIKTFNGALQSYDSQKPCGSFPWETEKRKRRGDRQTDRQRRADGGSPLRNISKDNLYILER